MHKIYIEEGDNINKIHKNSAKRIVIVEEGESNEGTKPNEPEMGKAERDCLVKSEKELLLPETKTDNK
jgi:hypothetical protein